MNSETALRVIDTHGVGMEGGAEIISDLDLRMMPTPLPPERTGYAFKMYVRMGQQNLTFLYQVDIEHWQKADEGAKDLFRQIAKLTTRLTLLTQLTSMNAPV